MFLNDYCINEYFGINRTELPCEQIIISPLQKHINNLVHYNPPSEISEINSYKYIRDKALNKLLLDFWVKNLSFFMVNESNEISVKNSIQNIKYAYNILYELKLNEKITWNLMKFKFKPIVKCVVCNSQVNWDHEIIKNTNSHLKQENKQNMTDNW